MDKRYQVFVSSTYVDLRDARDVIFRTLMEMDCIPSGMELFPAIDQEAWEFIKRIIDDCDYYLIVLGARYGSLSDDGISFTEKEYDYAVSKGLKVLAFIHKNPDDLPAKLADGDQALKNKLAAFREKVATGRLVNFWEHTAELPGLVALSLSKTIRLYPAVGWVRANQISSETAIREQNLLLKENEALKARIKEVTREDTVKDIAGLDELVSIRISWKDLVHGKYYPNGDTITLSWRELFSALSPDIQQHPSDATANFALGKVLLFRKKPAHSLSVSVHHEDFKTVRVQLQALGLIEVVYTQTVKGGMALFWNLTPAGTKLMMESRSVRTSRTTPTDENNTDEGVS